MEGSLISIVPSAATTTRPLRLIAFAAIASGLLIRILPLVVMPGGPLGTCDGRAYWDLALALADGRGFTIVDPQLLAACQGLLGAVGPSHHFAPGLPVIESTFVWLLGDNVVALVLPLTLLSAAAVGVLWLTTGDLFGRQAAVLAAGAVSLEWTGAVFGTWLGYTENLVLIALTLTLWAIVRSLRDDRYVVLAGLFAGLGYLSKASIGWLFLIAGLGGLAYRVVFRGRAVFRNRWYWTGVAVFALPVLIWAYRNVSLFWDGTLLGLADAWQTSSFLAGVIATALNDPVQLAVGMAGVLPVLFGFVALPFVPLARPLLAGLRRWREEEAFGLMLAVGLIFSLGWFFAAAFWATDHDSLTWADPVRYVMPAQVPLLWLTLRRDHRASTRAWAASYVLLLAMSLLIPILMLPGLPFAQ